ncbi:metalloregulator ArsR/SmtB family transcription factor [Streptomyces cremeus]|uniref:ArsR/SmtB family transcription factor n=1 Tax=Streptomyces cremeus TaxID=66881 RepID=A0ABV5PI96_STRCM
MPELDAPDAPHSPGTPEGANTPAPTPASASPEPTAERRIHALDARTLRGLAHPLRIQLLRALRLTGPATASQLAEKLGESSGATSYHLRQLAAYGFVEDAPERGKGRERWWRASHDGTTFDSSLANSPDPAVRGAADLFVHEVANQHTQELSTWIATSRDWPEEWRRSTEMSDFTMAMTPESARELNVRLNQLIESYRPADDGEDLPEGTRQYRFHLHGFPLPRT